MSPPSEQSIPASVSVFVSYSREDEAMVLPIVKALQNAGFDLWWDRMLEAGTNYVPTTEKALNNADVVLVLWSKRSVDSHWVRDEAGLGRDTLRLAPATLDGTLPPLGFRQFQTIDLTQWKGNANAEQFQRLIRSMASIANQASAPAQAISPPPSAPISRRAMLALAGIGGIGLTGFAAWKMDMFGAGAAAQPSIAVLPFENLTANPKEAYFADGLAEELRASLSQVQPLQVAARTSSNQFRGNDLDARQIASKLGVAFLLDGSVQRANNTLKISAQIIDGRTGFDLWSETYERTMSDVFAIQNDIANTVVKSLLSTLASTDAKTALQVTGTRSIAAYEAYLRGEALYDKGADEESDRAALREYDAAISLDPNYAMAHAKRSRALTVIANSYSTGAEIKKVYALAEEAARRAITLKTDLAAAYSALGFVIFNGRLDVEGAAEPFAKAYALGPGDADILTSFATYAHRVGNFSEARRAVKRALELDPLNDGTFRVAASVEFSAGNYKECAALIGKTVELNSSARNVRAMLGTIDLLNNQPEQALEQFRAEASGLSKLRGLAIAHEMLGQEEEAREAMDTLINDFGTNSLYQQAEVLAQWGEQDAALDALEKAFMAGDSGLVQLRNDPLLKPLHGTRRFEDLLAKIGFTRPDAI